MGVAVAKKRAVGARKGMRSPCRVRLPHTPDGAAAFDASPDLLEVYAEVRVRIKDPRVRLDRWLVFTLGGHTLVIGFAPQNVVLGTGLFS